MLKGPARTLLASRDFVVLLCCNVLVGIAYSFVAPFMSMFGTREVGMSAWTFGIFMTVTSLAAIVISTLLARWSDTRYSRKSILLLGGVAGTLGYLGYAGVRDVLGLTLIGGVLLGIASNTFSQLFAYARDLLSRSPAVAPHEIPLYMNVFRLFFALAWTVGPAVAAWVMQRWSFRGTFLAAAGFFALFVVFVAFAVPRVAPSRESRLAAERVPLRVALREPRLLAHFLGFALFFACWTMGMMNLPLLLLGELGGTETHVGIAYSVAPVFEIPFMFYFGLMASRGDHAKLIRGSFIAGVVYYGLLSVVSSPSLVFPIQILSAGIVAVSSGVAITFFQNFLPDQPGTATNLYSSSNRIGSTLGYLLFGSLAGGFGHRGVFAVCSALSFVAFAVLFAFRPPGPALAGGEP